jgi:hypothetical protein
VAPDDLGPGDAFTITGTVTVDPDAVDGGPLAWTLTIGPVAGAAFDDTACGNSTGTSCQAELSAAGDTVTVSGEVVTTPRGNVTAEVRIAGTVDATPGSDQASMTAATCGVVTAPGGTTVPGAGGRLSQGPAPEEGTPESTCAGVTGTIEAPITVPTPAPTEAPTEEPTEAPTATPEPTATATVEPTATVASATATTAPTAAAQPTPDEGGDGSTGLWIGAGALALLAAAAGVVWYQRRKVSA